MNIRSAANVLLGESLVYAFPEVRPNTTIVQEGEVLATTSVKRSERTSESIRNKIKLLLTSTLAEVKRRGSLASGLQFDANSTNSLAKNLLDRKKGDVELVAVALRSSDTADPVAVVLRIKRDNRLRTSKSK